MKDKSLELFTPEQLKLHEEFMLCETEEDLEKWDQKAKLLNEAAGNQIPHLNMTLKEFDEKYRLVTYEEIKKKMGMS